MKWHNLRCSYSRYLREMSTGRTRKKWRLADSMSFLNEYLGQNKKSDFSSTECETHYVKVEEDELTISEQSKIEDMNLYTQESRSSVDSFRPPSPLEETFQTSLTNYSSLSESQMKEYCSPYLISLKDYCLILKNCLLAVKELLN
ncbi:hypothetical protein WA026_018481 [Henosepilachna vigintioctopunctata]